MRAADPRNRPGTLSDLHSPVPVFTRNTRKLLSAHPDFSNIRKCGGLNVCRAAHNGPRPSSALTP
jgi:hypothetical protein